MHRARHFKSDPRRVVHETIDDETILVDLATGAYYSLRGSGPEIWDLVTAGCSEADLIGELRRRHPADGATIPDATSALIERLHCEGLLEEIEESERPTLRSAQETPGVAPFEAPVLERYTDMEYFLLLDPIHEVGADGWPHPRPAGPPQAASS